MAIFIFVLKYKQEGSISFVFNNILSQKKLHL